MSKKSTSFHYFPRLFLVAILVLSLLYLGGCASRQASPTAGQEAATTSQEGASQTSRNSDSDAVRESESQASTERRIGISQGQAALRLLLPVGDDTRVDADYQGSRLSLTFDPPVPGPMTHESIKGTMIKGIEYKPSPKAGQISGISISMRERTQYTLSRGESDHMELSLTRPQESEATAEQTPPSRQLKDIEFYQTDSGGLKIVLTGEETPDYKLRPSEDDKLHLSLPGTRIPSPQTKLYDLGEFDTPVEEALLSNSQSGGQVHLSMSRRIPVKLDREGASVVLRVDAERRQVAEKSEFQVQEPEEKESGQQQVRNQSVQASEASSGQEPGPLAKEGASLGEGIILPGSQENYTGKPISIDVQNAELSHVLRLLSEVGGFNLVMDKGVGGTITLKLDEVPWDQALALVLQQKDLGMAREGKILRIAPIDQLRQEQQRIIQARKSALEAKKSKEELEPLQTEYIQINYSKAQALQSQVQNFLSDRGEVSHDPRTNQLIVSDTSQALEKIKSVVDKLDQAERQVMIEARVVYATDSFTESLGLQWGGGFEASGEQHVGGAYGGSGTSINVSPSVSNSGFAVNVPNEGATTMGLGGFVSKITGSNLFTLDAQLQIGETKGQVKTISKPKVVTLNNQEAVVEQGTMLATQSESESGGTTTEYTEATLNLTVTPQITPDNKLIMEIQVSDDSPGGGGNIETRSVETKLIVDDGNTVVLGGVQELSETESQQRVPGLADIPLLGWLFKNEFTSQEKRELLVFIRPKIL